MIVSGRKLIVSPARPVVSNGAVFFSRGRIQAAGPLTLIKQAYPGHRVISLDNSVILPGLVNAHAHLELPFLLEAIRADTFTDWVLRLIAVKKTLVTSDYRRAAIDNINMLIRTGTTTVAEICTHGVSPAILKKSRLRAVIFDEMISMKPPGKEGFLRIPSPGLRRSSLISQGLSPHAPYTVSEASLRQISARTSKRNFRIAMHVGESADELRLLQGKRSRLEKIYKYAKWDRSWAPSGSSLFAYLNRTGVLSPRFLAVHAVHANAADVRIIRETGAAVAHCPRSNRALGVGRMPLRKFLDAGITVGLGTDSLASSPSINMWDEMRYALKIHKRDGITARDIFKLATIGGAKALGLDKDIGSIEIGKKADLIAVPLPSKDTGEIYSDLIRETNSCIMTMINGSVTFLKGNANYKHGSKRCVPR